MQTDSREIRSVRALVPELRDWIEPHIIARGYDYYLEGRVTTWSIKGDAIEATVTGSSGKYETRVNLVDFGDSECDCPFEDYCKHMVAVVYTVARGAALLSKDTEENTKEADLDKFVDALSRLAPEQVRQVLRLSMQDNSQWATHLEMWFHRWQNGHSLQQEIRTMNLEEAIPYLKNRVGQVVAEAESLFQVKPWNPQEDELYDRWGDPIYDTDEWDCHEGVNHIKYWCHQLKESARGSRTMVVPALIGLSLTLVSVSNWTSRFPDEAEAELSGAATVCEGSLERTAQELCKQLVRQPDLRQSVIQFTDWIAAQCEDMLDLEDWTEVLFNCTLDGDHLRQFKARCLEKNPAFLHSPELYRSPEASTPFLRLYNEHGRYLVDWWCTLCLAHGDVEDAESSVESPAPGVLPSVRSGTMKNLADYFHTHRELEKAAKYAELALRLNLHSRGEDYDWLAGIYESNEMIVQATRARESALYAGPTWERFEACLKDLATDALRGEKVLQWTFTIVQQGRVGLACRMLWVVGEKEAAWRVLEKSRISAYTVDNHLRTFLADFANHDATRIINIYRRFVDECIRRKSRDAYRDATRWMGTLRDTWQKANQLAEWQAYIRDLMNEYNRYRALKDEIQMAGLA